MSKQGVKPGRRSFLRKTALFGGAAVAVGSAAAATAGESGTDARSDAEPAAGPQGYRETDHIRSYYDKARF